MRGNIIRSVPMVEVARNTKNAAHPASEKKFRRLIRQMPRSSSGGLSCLGFLIAPAVAGGFGGGTATAGADVELDATGGLPAGGGVLFSVPGPLGLSITPLMSFQIPLIEREKYSKKIALSQTIPPRAIAFCFAPPRAAIDRGLLLLG